MDHVRFSRGISGVLHPMPLITGGLVENRRISSTTFGRLRHDWKSQEPIFTCDSVLPHPTTWSWRGRTGNRLWLRCSLSASDVVSPNI
jgi:hypothetical protein